MDEAGSSSRPARRTRTPPQLRQGAADTVTRSIEGLDGGLEATTGATGGTTLQLTTLHGDISVQLPLDAVQPVTLFSADEYGSPKAGSATSRYGWLGRYQRAYDNADGNIVVGMRMYSPVQGRFLSADPVAGGSSAICTSHLDRCSQNPWRRSQNRNLSTNGKTA
ncbi:hypothetical protein [Streptomyces sp. CBMA29]|uniref:hypothetical protein n=1 Tax=Streptomyces sp. CBMA29 TaxID=1896314 RepID=UPI001661A01A|nr:hypothetical protein [Streptomyces sp. CBMA29]